VDAASSDSLLVASLEASFGDAGVGGIVVVDVDFVLCFRDDFTGVGSLIIGACLDSCAAIG